MKEDFDKFTTGSPAKKEIEELHQFFTDWFNGKIDEDISRFSSVIAEDFELITPSGNKINRKSMVSSIENSYGSHPDRKIWVENISTRVVGDMIMSTYEEFQEIQGKTTKRISSALFSFDPNQPNMCSWHHVHETWLS